MNTTDWDSQVVIGYKAKTRKVTRNTSDLNGERKSLKQSLVAEHILPPSCKQNELSLVEYVSEAHVRRGEQAPSLRRIRNLPLVETRLILVCSDVTTVLFYY